jgi:general secretion pathway protein L
MRRNRKQPQPSPILRLLKWWLRELGDMVPAALRPRIRPPSRLIWVQAEAGQLTFTRRLRGGSQTLGQIPLDAIQAPERKIAFDALHARAGRLPLGVVLRDEQVLRKRLTLPLAAAQNLRQVVAFELGRQTPFTHDQAYFDARRVGEDRARQTLQVELAVTPRQSLDEMMACFKAWGVNPQFIAVAGELSGKDDCVNLLPPEQRPRPGTARYWGYAAMAGVTLLLLAAVLMHRCGRSARWRSHCWRRWARPSNGRIRWKT